MRRRVIFSILLFLAFAPWIVRAQIYPFTEDGIHFVRGYYDGQPMHALEIHDGYLYADDERFLLAMKMHSPTDLEEIYFEPYSETRHSSIASFTYFNGHLFAASEEQGKSFLSMYEVSDPAAIKLVSSLDGVFASSNLTVHNGRLFGAGRLFLHRFEIGANNLPYVADSVRTDFMVNPDIGPLAAFRDTTIFYIHDDNIMKGNYLKLSGAQPLNFFPPYNSLLVVEDILYGGSVFGFVGIFRLDDNNNPTKIGEISNTLFFGGVQFLYQHENYLIVLSSHAGFFVYDITTPETPIYKGSVTRGADNWFDLRIRGRYIYAIASGDVNELLIFETDIFTSASPPPPAPASLALAAAYPNPVTSGSAATVEFALPASGHVTLTLCNTLGQELRRIEKRLEPGTHSERLSTIGLNPGVYYYTLTAEGKRETEMLVVR